MFEIAAIIVLCLYVLMAVLIPGVALITAPVTYALITYAAVCFDSPGMFILAIVGFVATLGIIAIRRRSTDTVMWPQRWARRILASLGLLILLIIGLLAGLALYAVGAGLLVVYFGAAWLALLLVSYGLSLRHASDIYVLSTIGASMRQSLPLPMALEQAAAGRTDKRGRILLSIKKWLVQGYSLSESIERGWPRCPGQALGMIRTAERIGQLPCAFAAVEANMLAMADERRRIRPVHPVYPLIVITWAFAVVSGLMKFVFPQFMSVLQEMGDVGGRSSLPAATQVLLSVMGFVHGSQGSVVVFAVGLLVVAGMVVLIRVKFRPRRPQKPYMFSRIGDFIKWHLPILHWFERNYSMVQVVELLRLSLNAGCTIDRAIANTLNLDVNCRFRARLKRWLGKVERGDNVADAAKKSGLGGSLAWAFDDSVNQENTIPILEMLESFYRSNYSYVVNLARFILWPCGIVLLGVTVGFMVFATFSAGVAILTHLAQNVYP